MGCRAKCSQTAGIGRINSLGNTRNTFVWKLSLVGDEWSPLRALSACGQILHKNPGKGQTPPPFRQCLHFGSIWTGNPSLTTKEKCTSIFRIFRYSCLPNSQSTQHAFKICSFLYNFNSNLVDIFQNLQIWETFGCGSVVIFQLTEMMEARSQHCGEGIKSAFLDLKYHF